MSSTFYRAWTNKVGVKSDVITRFKKYVRQNKAFMVDIGDYVFDLQSLSSKICLSQCMRCEKYQEHNCCCGNSYSLPQENIVKLDSIVEDVIKSIPNGYRRLDSYYSCGAFTKNNTTTTRGHENGYCIFSMIDPDDGCSKCAIHKWCLDNEKNPIEYKPYICSLFPLEGIVTPTGKTFVFCSDKHTRDFSMYFYTLTRRVCINEENTVKVCAGDRSGSKYLKGVNRDNLVKDNILSKMNPSYIEQEEVLRFLCGDEVYDMLLLKCIGTHM